MSLALFPLKILLIAIDLFISLVTFKWIGVLQKTLGGTKYRSEAVDGDESHRVKVGQKGNLVTVTSNGSKTVGELAQFSFKTYPDKKCTTSREFLGWKSKKVKEFGGTKTLTYADVQQASDKFGAALAAAGVKAAPTTTNLEKVNTNSRIAIFENTCAEWMIAALGAFSQSISVVTVYATLGIDAVAEAVNDNIVSVIVCNKSNVGKLVSMKSGMPTLTTIVYTNDLVGPNDSIEIPDAPAGVTIMSFDDFVASGDTAKYPVTLPEPDTTAVIMYTSGSTGKPKGVVITQRQLLCIIAAAEIEFGVVPDDVYVAYLPLAHIMELCVEFIMIGNGCHLCYADPKSLSATGAYPVGALELYSPTLFIAVPKIWDTLKKGILAKVALGPPVAQFLVHTALAWRGFCLSIGLDTPLFNALVFKKFKKAVGGKLRMAVSGGGPLNGEVQTFVRIALVKTFVQGYGLTETCAAATLQGLDDDRTGVQGFPVPCCEVKLVSTPDVGDKAGQPYLSTDRFDVEGNPVFGRGEICIKGGNISSGYYMMPDKTAEVYAEDGWFHTGDIGQFLSDGSVRIVDRKKNLVKLKGGEYVALEKMEMTYGNSSFVNAIEGGICCYGDGDMDRPVALMQLSEPVAMAWAKANGVTGEFSEVKKSKELYNAVMDDMKKEHGNSDLSHLEKLVAVVFMDEPWTPENGCLTAANKLQRRTVITMFEKDFLEVKEKGIFH